MDRRQLRKLADQSASFGFLLPYPLLLFYGAGAETLVHVSAQAAMFKARAFGEVMAEDLLRRTGARPEKDFYHRVRALNAGGVLEDFPKVGYHIGGGGRLIDHLDCVDRNDRWPAAA